MGDMNQSSSKLVGARDRFRQPPNAVYAKQILEPIFEYNCRYNFYPLIDAHRAWLTMLAEEKIVPAKTAAPILRALDEIEKQGADACRPFDAAVEFYYLHMERALVQRVPGGEEAVGNLNLGRTRPEPLARMVMRDALIRTLQQVLAMRKTLLDRAQNETETVMPGYTHLLHAQPTTLAHYLLAIHDHLARDTQRLLAAYQTTDQCTLGCGAMSGTSLPVNRERVRELLGFSKLCENTIDSVSATDHVTESASALASTMLLLGRLAQDLYIFSSQEFNLIDITDAFASPSSLMPQKKNALVLEYVRSRTAQTIGHLTGSLAVLHNVGYMDTEEVELECHQPLMDAFTLVGQALPTMNAFVASMQPNRELMKQRTAWGFSSVTALAETIQMQKNVSYRTAHRIVARAVLLAVESHKDATGIDGALLDRASNETLGRALGLSPDSITQALNPRNFIDHHSCPGGPAPKEVRRMIEGRRLAYQADERPIADREQALTAARSLLQRAVHTLVQME